MATKLYSLWAFPSHIFEDQRGYLLISPPDVWPVIGPSLIFRSMGKSAWSTKRRPEAAWRRLSSRTHFRITIQRRKDVISVWSQTYHNLSKKKVYKSGIHGDSCWSIYIGITINNDWSRFPPKIDSRGESSRCRSANMNDRDPSKIPC